MSIAIVTINYVVEFCNDSTESSTFTLLLIPATKVWYSGLEG